MVFRALASVFSARMEKIRPNTCFWTITLQREPLKFYMNTMACALFTKNLYGCTLSTGSSHIQLILQFSFYPYSSSRLFGNSEMDVSLRINNLLYMLSSSRHKLSCTSIQFLKRWKKLETLVCLHISSIHVGFLTEQLQETSRVQDL